MLCTVCNEKEAKKRCNGCKSKYYCSRKCQVQDWKKHKPKCTPSPGLSKKKESKTKTLKRKIRFHNPHPEDEVNTAILRNAIKPNEDGEYGRESFTFVRDEEEDVVKEKIEIEEQRKLFIDYSRDRKSKKLEFIRYLGQGSSGRAFLFRMTNLDDKNHVVEGNKSSIFEGGFVMKISLDSYEDDSGWVDRDSLQPVTYHRNVAPVVFHSTKFPIDLEQLPLSMKEKKAINKFGVAEQIRGVVILKFHRKDLKKYVNERVEINRPFRDLELCYILRGILRGAKHLRDNFIIHRDLYPENIFVSEAYGRLWIGDFGLALDLRQSKGFKIHKNEREILYSCSESSSFKKGGLAERISYENYLAPEIMNFDVENDEYLDYSKSDLYSIGMIMKFVILEFYHDDVTFEKLKAFYMSQNTQEILTIVQKLLEKDPDSRIGYEESIEVVGKIISKIESKSGTLSFEFEEKEKKKTLIDMERQWGKYRDDGNNRIRHGKYEESFLCFKKALLILESHFPENNWDIFLCYFRMGLSLRSSMHYTQSAQFYSKSKDILLVHFPQEYRYISSCFLSIGEIMTRLRKYEWAKSSLEIGFSIRMTYLSHDGIGLAECYRLLAEFYDSSGDSTMSYKFYQICIEFERKMIESKQFDKSEDVRIDMTYFNFALFLQKQGKYRESNEHYEKSMALMKLHFSKNHSNLSKCYINIGFNHFKLNEVTKALEYFKMAKDIYELNFSVGHHELSLNVYRNIGTCLETMGKLEKSLKYFRKGNILDVEGNGILQMHVDRVQKKIGEKNEK